MPMLLHVNANARPRGQSRSLRVADAFLEGYRSAHPDAQVHEEALFAEELSLTDSVGANARIHQSRGQQLEGEEKARFDRIMGFIEPLKKCDVLLISTPMWNFGPPWKLKQWIDTVTQARITFEYTASGPRGLLSAKGALVGSRGGVYKPGDPRETRDFLEPYLRWCLQWIGITDVHACWAEGIDANKDRAEEILAKAEGEARRLGASM